MPKQTHKIEGFHGGISSDTDPRDIKDIESPVLVDASVDSFGRIKTLGSVSATVDVNTCVLEPNLGLFTMDSDKDIAGADSNETFIIHLKQFLSGNVSHNQKCPNPIKMFHQSNPTTNV